MKCKAKRQDNFFPCTTIFCQVIGGGGFEDNNEDDKKKPKLKIVK